jgi:TatD DNase family protein
MTLVDAHCHLSSPEVFDRAPELIRAGMLEGIGLWLLGGYDSEDWERQRTLSQRYPHQIMTSFGLHPWVVQNLDADSAKQYMDELIDLFNSDAIPNAIGEIGLDRSLRSYRKNWRLQLELFERQVLLANDQNLPVILHVVQSHGIALEVLNRSLKASARRGMVHSFVGAADIADQYRKMGIVPSLSPRSLAKVSRQDLAAIVRHDFLIESDFPAHIGSAHDSKTQDVMAMPHTLLREVADAIASSVGGSCGEWQERCGHSFDRVFGGLS